MNPIHLNIYTYLMPISNLHYYHVYSIFPRSNFPTYLYGRIVLRSNSITLSRLEKYKICVEAFGASNQRTSGPTYRVLHFRILYVSSVILPLFLETSLAGRETTDGQEEEEEEEDEPLVKVQLTLVEHEKRERTESRVITKRNQVFLLLEEGSTED